MKVPFAVSALNWIAVCECIPMSFLIIQVEFNFTNAVYHWIRFFWLDDQVILVQNSISDFFESQRRVFQKRFKIYFLSFYFFRGDIGRIDGAGDLGKVSLF